MVTNDAARRYYSALLGAWRGPLHLTRTGRSLAGAPPRLRALAVGFGLSPRLWMATTLDTDAGGFKHTTLVTLRGVMILRTEEKLLVDGARLTMRGVQRTWLGGEPYEATGVVSDAADGATYDIPWAGAALVQRTQIVPEGLRLWQETQWTRAEVLLQRA